MMHKQPTCPSCGNPLELGRSAPSNWPYIHVDLVYKGCCNPDGYYVFGVPEDPTIGLDAIIVWAEDLEELREMVNMVDIPKRECPFGHGSLKLTKLLRDGDHIAFQMKCPTCFYAYHEPHSASNAIGNRRKGI